MEFEGDISEGLFIQIIKEGFGEIIFFPYDMPKRMRTVLEAISTEQESLPITLAILLEHPGDTAHRSCWYLTGTDFPNQIPTIRVVREDEFREALLNQIVDISFRDERPDVILQRLVGRAGMELVLFKEEPSWLDEEITVNMQNVSLRQALLNIVNTVDGDMNFF